MKRKNNETRVCKNETYVRVMPFFAQFQNKNNKSMSFQGSTFITCDIFLKDIVNNTKNKITELCDDENTNDFTDYSFLQNKWMAKVL